eukprot:g2293.t1
MIGSRTAIRTLLTCRQRHMNMGRYETMTRSLNPNIRPLMIIFNFLKGKIPNITLGPWDEDPVVFGSEGVAFSIHALCTVDVHSIAAQATWKKNHNGDRRFVYLYYKHEKKIPRSLDTYNLDDRFKWTFVGSYILDIDKTTTIAFDTSIRITKGKSVIFIIVGSGSGVNSSDEWEEVENDHIRCIARNEISNPQRVSRSFRNQGQEWRLKGLKVEDAFPHLPTGCVVTYTAYEHLCAVSSCDGSKTGYDDDDDDDGIDVKKSTREDAESESVTWKPLLSHGPFESKIANFDTLEESLSIRANIDAYTSLNTGILSSDDVEDVCRKMFKCFSPALSNLGDGLLTRDIVSMNEEEHAMRDGHLDGAKAGDRWKKKEIKDHRLEVSKSDGDLHEDERRLLGVHERVSGDLSSLFELQEHTMRRHAEALKLDMDAERAHTSNICTAIETHIDPDMSHDEAVRYLREMFPHIDGATLERICVRALAEHKATAHHEKELEEFAQKQLAARAAHRAACQAARASYCAADEVTLIETTLRDVVDVVTSQKAASEAARVARVAASDASECRTKAARSVATFWIQRASRVAHLAAASAAACDMDASFAIRTLTATRVAAACASASSTAAAQYASMRALRAFDSVREVSNALNRAIECAVDAARHAALSASRSDLDAADAFAESLHIRNAIRLCCRNATIRGHHASGAALRSAMDAQLAVVRLASRHASTIARIAATRTLVTVNMILIQVAGDVARRSAARAAIHAAKNATQSVRVVEVKMVAACCEQAARASKICLDRALLEIKRAEQDIANIEDAPTSLMCMKVGTNENVDTVGHRRSTAGTRQKGDGTSRERRTNVDEESADVGLSPHSLRPDTSETTITNDTVSILRGSALVRFALDDRLNKISQDSCRELSDSMHRTNGLSPTDVDDDDASLIAAHSLDVSSARRTVTAEEAASAADVSRLDDDLDVGEKELAVDAPAWFRSSGGDESRPLPDRMKARRHAQSVEISRADENVDSSARIDAFSEADGKLSTLVASLSDATKTESLRCGIMSPRTSSLTEIIADLPDAELRLIELPHPDDVDWENVGAKQIDFQGGRKQRRSSLLRAAKSARDLRAQVDGSPVPVSPRTQKLRTLRSFSSSNSPLPERSNSRTSPAATNSPLNDIRMFSTSKVESDDDDDDDDDLDTEDLVSVDLSDIAGASSRRSTVNILSDLGVDERDIPENMPRLSVAASSIPPLPSEHRPYIGTDEFPPLPSTPAPFTDMFSPLAVFGNDPTQRDGELPPLPSSDDGNIASSKGASRRLSEPQAYFHIGDT